MPFTRCFLTLLKITALSGVGIMCAGILYTVFLLFASAEFRVSALRFIGLDALAERFGTNSELADNGTSALPPDLRDLFTVRQDHNAIRAG